MLTNRFRIQIDGQHLFQQVHCHAIGHEGCPLGLNILQFWAVMLTEPVIENTEGFSGLSRAGAVITSQVGQHNNAKERAILNTIATLDASPLAAMRTASMGLRV